MPPTLVITRPDPAATRFVAAIEKALGRSVPVVHSPAFRIDPVEVPHDVAAEHYIFTSLNGVSQSPRLGLSDGQAWCVGDRTTAEASAFGFDAISAGGDADNLVSLIKSRRPSGKMVHICGQDTRGDVAQRLTRAGIACDAIVAYRQVPLSPSAALRALAKGTAPVVLPFFSPRSVLGVAGLAWHGPVFGIAMSGAVADTMVDMGFDVIETADQPTQAAMVARTTAVIQRLLDR